MIRRFHATGTSAYLRPFVNVKSVVKIIAFLVCMLGAAHGFAQCTPDTTYQATFVCNGDSIFIGSAWQSQPGSYSDTYTNTAGCDSVVITQLSVDTVFLFVVSTNATCGMSNGSAAAQASGGFPPYTYAWSNGATDSAATNLSAGIYYVTAFDQTGCSAMDSVVITNTSPPVPTVTATNTSCGLNNGAATASATSGTGPYTYSWSNGATTSSISNLAAGTYSVTVTDSGGCTASDSTSVATSTSITVTLFTTNTTCGQSNGSITANASGAISPYTYAWSNGTTTQTIGNLSSGTYTVTVTSADGCTATQSDSVGASSSPSVALSATATTCGLSNGSIASTVTSGAPPYTFLWSNSATDQNITALASGSYSVTVTDANNCSATATTSVAASSSPSVSATATNATCGNANGSVNVTVTNGASPYTFIWSNTATTQNLANVSAGTYTVTVTDANNCSGTGSATVTTTTTPTLTVNSPSICSGQSATLTASGATFYTWAPATGLTPTTGASVTANPTVTTTYTVTGTAANGCSATATSVVTVNNAASITATSTNSTCGQTNGSISLNVSGGNNPYTFAWSANAGGATTQNLTNLAAGTYSVTVTTTNGCTSVASATVGNAPSPTLSHTSTPATCGNANGSIVITIANGTAPFFFSWSNGATTQNLSNIPASTYTITVTDVNNCTASSTIVLTGTTALQVSSTVTNASCGLSNGGVTLSVSGGASPYSFTWSNGTTTQNLASVSAGSYSVTVNDAGGCSAATTITVNGTSAVMLSTTVTNATCNNANGSVNLSVTSGTSPYTFAWSNGITTQNISNVATGSYTVTVHDANNCSASATATVTNTPPPTLSAFHTNTACGNNIGSVSITVSGGTAPFTFIWSNGATTQSIGSLAAGTYTVTIHDANNCTATASATVNPSSAVNIVATTNNASCGSNNGSIALTVTGATPPYIYAWSNGATTSSLNNLAAGNYTVTVTDAASCTKSQTVSLSNTGAPTVTTTVTNATCNNSNGHITATATGGVQPYAFAWSNGATTQNINNLSAGIYTLTVTDAVGCMAITHDTLTNTQPPVVSVNAISICNGQSDTLIASGASTYTWSPSTGLNATSGANVIASPTVTSTYTVTGTATNGCSASATAVVTVNALPTIVIAPSSATICSGASVQLIVTGGTGYAWVPNAGLSTVINDTVIATPSVTTTYQVTVTNAAGCTAVASVVINVSFPPSLTLNATAASCGNANGSVAAFATGGATPYSYVWSNGSTQQNINNLAAGTYTVTVTTAAGCSSTASTTITTTTSATLNAVSSTTMCGNSNGTASVVATGGSSPYDYSWDNGATSSTLFGLSAGQYSVTVTTASGCTSTTTVNVSGSSSPVAALNAQPTTCGNANGSIALTVTQGMAPYTYLWSNGASLQTVSNLAAGAYTVTVTDTDGCTATQTATVNSSTSPTVTGNVTNAACGNNNGSINLNVSGGTLPYTFAWSNGSTSQNVNNLAAGTYAVTTTDANGCTDSATEVVSNVNGPTVAYNATSVSCGQNNGSITLNITGGTPPYNIIWSNGSTSSAITNLSAGTFDVTVTDANNCQSVQSIQVSGVAPPSVSAAVNDAMCGSSNGSINATGIGGTPPYTYLWSTGATDATIGGLSGGNYDLTITDANGCSAAFTYPVGSSLPPQLNVTVTNATCSQANGIVTLDVTNGTAPFIYAWSNGGTDQNLIAVLPGSYDVTVTDDNGCFTIQTVAVNDVPGPSLSSTVVDATCNGSDGSIDLVVSSGTPPFIVNWSNGGNGTTLDSLTAGYYTVTVLDANYCTASQTILVNSGVGPYSNYATADAVCGGASGSVDLTVGGGTSPYTFHWSNGATTEDVSGLAVGLYSVTITDANGCSSTNDALITSTAPAPTLTDAVTQATCGQVNGAISVTVSGGSAPYQFQWSNGATVQNLSNLQPGVYTLTLTDANGCQSALFETINPSSSPAIGAISNMATCGGANGSVALTVNGGIMPYSYLWSNGATSGVVTGLHGGDYSVTVTDSSGCNATLTITVDSTAAMILGAIAGNDSAQHFSSATYAVASQPGAVYSWNVIGGTVTAGQGTNVVTVTWADTGIGVLFVTGTNTDNCTATDSLHVTIYATGINDLFYNIPMQLYPNPTTDQSILSVTVPFGMRVSLQAFAVDGRLRNASEIKLHSGVNDIPVDVRQLPAGVYMLRLQSNSMTGMQKLEVNR